MTSAVLVAGAAGFIGADLSQHLFHSGDRMDGPYKLNYFQNLTLNNTSLSQIKVVAPQAPA